MAAILCCMNDSHAYERVPIDMTQNPPVSVPIAFKLSHMPLVYGVMAQMNLAKEVNDRIPKLGTHEHIQAGAMLEFMCARYLAGEIPLGINELGRFALSLPANLLGVEETADANPYEQVSNVQVAADLLDGIAKYGPTRFQSEIISSIVDTNSVEVAYLGSTSYHVYGKPGLSAYEDLFTEADVFGIANKPVTHKSVAPGKDKPVLPPVHQVTVSAKVKGIETEVMLYQADFEEDKGDTARFQEFCSDGELKQLKQVYPNLRTLVGDLSLAISQAIQACHACGVEFVSKLPKTKLKQDFAKVNDGKIKLSSVQLPMSKSGEEDADGQEVQFAWLEPSAIKLQDKNEISVQRV